MTALAYADASAIAKLVLVEPGSQAMLRWFIESERVISNRVAQIEVHRAASRVHHEPARLAMVLKAIETFELDEDVTLRAKLLEPPMLRTLDAIHVATALAIGPTLDAFVTYDDRLADAARAAGLPVVRPA